jgi:EmrB/QacA subfamily drug resistance transporter
MLAVDITIVTVANPSIQRALHFTPSTLEWTVNGYAVAFGGLILLGGRLSDVAGPRRVFTAGIACFTLASVGAGLSQTAVELTLARAAQGACAAAVSPAALACLAATFDEGPSRHRAYGIWATAGSAGGLIGFAAGGVLTGTLGWQWVFFVNGPVGVAVFVAASILLDRDRATTGARIDVPGALLVTAGLSLVLYGLSRAYGSGWGSPSVWLPELGGAVLLAAFAVWELRNPEPLVPLPLLIRPGTIGNLFGALQSMVAIATMFLVALYLQQVLGYSPLRGGFATLPLPVGFALGVNVASRLLPRSGVRGPGVAGFGLVACGTAWLAVLPSGAAYAVHFVPALVVVGAGLGLVMVPSIVLVTTRVAPADQGVVGGIYSMCQQTGGALGLAVLSTVAAEVAAGGGTSGEVRGLQAAYWVAAAICLASAGLVASMQRSPALATASLPGAGPQI